jgi:hypothetical protein
MLWLTTAFSAIRGLNFKVPLLIVAALALFSAGGMANGYRWGEKYQEREVEIRDQRIKDVEKLNAEWDVVARLQDQYKELNKETYNDLRKKLDEVAASVAANGTRVVRICSLRPTAAPAPKVSVPRAAGRTIADGADGLPGAVESDPGPSGDPEGYDIFPEVNAMMVEATKAGVTCNQLIDWQQQARALVVKHGGVPDGSRPPNP